MNRLLQIFVLSFLLLSASAIFAQDGLDPGTVNGGIDGGVPLDGGDLGDGGGQDGVNDGGGGGGGGGGTIDAGELATEVGERLDDERSQGFVGATGSAIESGNTDILGGSPGFIGPTSEVIEAISGAPDVPRQGGAAGQGSAEGQMNGFEVSRSTVRARVVPNFTFNDVPKEVLSQRFEQRLLRIPNVGAAAASGIRVEIQGTTALISGSAPNQRAIDDLLGQLRMEPGVYRIINDVKIANAIDQNGNPAGLSFSNN